MKVYQFLTEVIDGISSKIVQNQKKKVKLNDIELLVKERFGDVGLYRLDGGYRAFFNAVVEKVNAGDLVQITSSGFNLRSPKLHNLYWINGKKQLNHINTDFLFEMSDLLNLSFFEKNKIPIDRQECLKIRKIYEFLKNANEHDVIGREERSLMLFNEVGIAKLEAEKFLGSAKGKALLRRLGLTYQDLKCKPCREFEYWKNENRTFETVRKILIVEGLNTYNTLANLCEEQRWPFQNEPHLILFGRGSQISAIFEKLKEKCIGNAITISYFGDLDPEGYNIYYRLREKYKDFQLSLAADLYHFIYKSGKHYSKPIEKDQDFNKQAFKHVCNELIKMDTGLVEMLNELWINKRRIPQEALNRDTLKMVRR